MRMVTFHLSSRCLVFEVYDRDYKDHWMEISEQCDAMHKRWTWD